MSQKKVNKLISYLERGKSISGSKIWENESGDSITTQAFIVRPDKDIFIVEVDEYFSNIDVSDYDLRNEKHQFNSFDDAIRFLEEDEGIPFVSMHG